MIHNGHLFEILFVDHSRIDDSTSAFTIWFGDAVQLTLRALVGMKLLPYSVDISDPVWQYIHDFRSLLASPNDQKLH